MDKIGSKISQNADKNLSVWVGALFFIVLGIAASFLSCGAGWERSQILSLSVSVYLAHSPGAGQLTSLWGQFSQAIVMNGKLKIIKIINILFILYGDYSPAFNVSAKSFIIAGENLYSAFLISSNCVSIV